jgi:hypothetical protein
MDLMNLEEDKIPKTDTSKVPFTLVKIGPVNNTNPKYAGTFRIQDKDGAAGRLLVQPSFGKVLPAYEEAYEKKTEVPVVVWSDDGLARPYTAQDKERFEQGK